MIPDTDTLPGMNIAALQRFLVDLGVPLHGQLHAELLAGGRSNLTFKLSDDRSTWVLRRPPTTGLTPSAHDMIREWTVTNALQRSRVPVAATVAHDPDGAVLGAPFTIVDFVDGRVIRDRADLDALSDAEIATSSSELVRVLVALHQVDVEAVGLTSFGRPHGFLTRQVALWARQWERVKTRDLRDVERLHAALARTIPTESAAAIVHGDYRVDNVIIHDDGTGHVAAVVDWEMSTLGDPLTDVALMCAYRQPIFDAILGMQAAWTSARYPAPNELADMYAAQSGSDLPNWEFYCALANFKLGVIGEGITHRAQLDSTSTVANATQAAEVTHEFMAAGLRALKATAR